MELLATTRIHIKSLAAFAGRNTNTLRALSDILNYRVMKDEYTIDITFFLQASHERRTVVSRVVERTLP